MAIYYTKFKQYFLLLLLILPLNSCSSGTTAQPVMQNQQYMGTPQRYNNYRPPMQQQPYPYDNDRYYNHNSYYPGQYAPAYNYEGKVPAPRSNEYRNPYEVPSMYHPYYDSDQYYVPSYQGNGVSDDSFSR